MNSETNDIDVLTVGESMALLTPPAGCALVDAETLDLRIGGAESNVAMFLAQLGAKVAWVGRIGDDPLGNRIVAELKGVDVDVSAVEVDASRPTGVYFKDFDGMTTKVHYYRAGSAASMLAFAPIEPMLKRARILHLTGITAALSARCRSTVFALMRHARQLGVGISFDVNYRSGLWDVPTARPVLTQLAELADVVFVGADEAERVWQVADLDDIRTILPDVPTIVVKNDSVGATSYQRLQATFVPAPRVDVLEYVGAGDAFASGYLWGVLNGVSETVRLRRGHLIAAAALQSVSDHTVPPSPTWSARMCALPNDLWAALDLREDPALREHHARLRLSRGRGVKCFEEK